MTQVNVRNFLTLSLCLAFGVWRHFGGVHYFQKKILFYPDLQISRSTRICSVICSVKTIYIILVIRISMVKQKITVTIDEDLIRRLDVKRGLIPRSAFIEYVLANTDFSKIH